MTCREQAGLAGQPAARPDCAGRVTDAKSNCLGAMASNDHIDSLAGKLAAMDLTDDERGLLDTALGLDDVAGFALGFGGKSLIGDDVGIPLVGDDIGVPLRDRYLTRLGVLVNNENVTG